MSVRPPVLMVVGHARDATELERSQARVWAARYAHEHGYDLWETYDVDATDELDAGVLDEVGVDLAEQRAGAVLVLDVRDLDDLRAVCGQVPVLVISRDPERPLTRKERDR